MKRKVLLKTFFQFAFSDKNTCGVTISDEAVQEMHGVVLDSLKQLFLNYETIPYHCLYNWTDEDNKGEIFYTKDLELVKSIKIYQ